jgi:nucleoside phosphorylase
MGTLKGFPNPPAMGLRRRSRLRPDAIRTPILIVAAFPPELKALASVLRARAQRGAPAVARAVVGVGAVEAAAGAARALALLEPRAVVLVGTAGVYAMRGGPAIGQAVLARRSALASLSAASGAGYLPAPVPDVQDTDPGLRRALADGQPLPALDVACPVAITRTRAAATALARHTGAALENLETFAVARACAQARTPFAAVLGISNRVGPQAHREWLRHATQAAAVACAVVERWLVSATQSSRKS